MRIRWEYFVLDCVSSSWATVAKELNELGADGWEVVWGENDGNKFVLKRPVADVPRQKV
jgi:hypothetical protein